MTGDNEPRTREELLAVIARELPFFSNALSVILDAYPAGATATAGAIVQLLAERFPEHSRAMHLFEGGWCLGALKAAGHVSRRGTGSLDDVVFHFKEVP